MSPEPSGCSGVDHNGFCPGREWNKCHRVRSQLAELFWFPFKQKLCFINPEDGGSIILRNVGPLLHAELQLTRSNLITKNFVENLSKLSYACEKQYIRIMFIMMLKYKILEMLATIRLRIVFPRVLPPHTFIFN